MKIILRILKVLFFLPCCMVDGITLIFIIFPIWVLTGKSMTNHKPILETLLELN